MKKLWKITLISTAVSAIIYFGLALVLTFLPVPTFAVAPFPVAETAVMPQKMMDKSNRPPNE
jgi:hypothetical protein